MSQTSHGLTGLSSAQRHEQCRINILVAYPVPSLRIPSTSIDKKEPFRLGSENRSGQTDLQKLLGWPSLSLLVESNPEQQQNKQLFRQDVFFTWLVQKEDAGRTSAPTMNRSIPNPEPQIPDLKS